MSTGYAIYGMEVMRRLHATGRYELAELGCFIGPGDPRPEQLPWQFFPNHPEPSNQREVAAFQEKPSNAWGEWKFEETCLKFRPDIVFTFRDWWMDSFIERSPFRRFFRWALMPAVDASPQHEQWLATFMDADAVFSYSDWGADVLRREGGGLIDVRGSASPGADLETFRPLDRSATRRKYGLDDDAFVIGMVARNQRRKLFPELLAAFNLFLGRAPEAISRKTYLYLHTTYPDEGWDISRLIKRSGTSRRVLVTYKCHRCYAVFPSFFADARANCPSCGAPEARMPTVQHAIDRVTLADLYNTFDVYVQYANSEGFGIPMVEAASCGIPVFAVDYSAMGDVVRKVRGYPIRVAGYRLDGDMGCERAVPDDSNLVDLLVKFSQKTADERSRLGMRGRRAVEEHYSWDTTAKRWSQAFDSLISRGVSPWNSPPDIFTPRRSPGRFGTNEEFVRWAIVDVLGKPELSDSYLSLRLIRDLNWGRAMKALAGNYASELSILETMGNTQPFTPDDAIRELTAMRDNINRWEQRRWETLRGNAS